MLMKAALRIDGKNVAILDFKNEEAAGAERGSRKQKEGRGGSPVALAVEVLDRLGAAGLEARHLRVGHPLRDRRRQQQIRR